MIHLSEFSTRGRLARTGFWFRHLTVIPLGLWMLVAAGHVPGPPYDLPLVLVFMTMLVSTWGRRLHDRGHSAWWLLGVFVPVIGAFALIVECGFRGSSFDEDLPGPGVAGRADYLTVAGAP